MPWPFKTTRRQRDDARNAGNAASIGIYFGVAIGIGAGGGTWIDNHFHVAPWGVMIGALLGIGSGFMNLIQVANEINRAEEDDRKRKTDTK